jgi:hypothetical protein
MADCAMDKLVKKRATDQTATADLQIFRPELTNRKVSA